MSFIENLLIEAVYRHTKKEILEDEMKTNAVKHSKLAALEAVKVRVRGYASDYFLFSLVLAIMEKKSRMILAASTMQELKEIIKPSVPRGNYGNFLEGPYHVMEEELIMWSMASLEAPLNDVGARRYQEVFSNVLPELAALI